VQRQRRLPCSGPSDRAAGKRSAHKGRTDTEHVGEDDIEHAFSRLATLCKQQSFHRIGREGGEAAEHAGEDADA
jgi:hypothetical protein